MRHLYTTLFYLLSPFIVLRLYWRSIRLPAYRARVSERFAWFKAPALQSPIWIHAVSVGEFLAILPFIKLLQMRYPDRSLVVTTTTPTGSAQVQKKLGDSVFHVYAPYDMPLGVKRFLRKIKPTMAIFMETEIWPNYVYYCRRLGLTSVLLNGRLSERSARTYLRFPRLMNQTMQCFSHVIAQFESDARRYALLGVPESRLSVAGNIKFDMSLDDKVLEGGHVLRVCLGGVRPVWVAASTHDCEEEQVLSAFKRIKQVLPDCLLILVPRHPDRFDRVADLCRRLDFKVVRRSTKNVCDGSTDIYLGDTMGDMFLFYAACDVAFVGGSLVATGCHNVLEPAQLKKSIITGPHVFNFAGVCHLLKEAGGLSIVNDEHGLSARVLNLLQDQILRDTQGEKAYAVVLQNRGALMRQLKIVERFLST